MRCALVIEAGFTFEDIDSLWLKEEQHPSLEVYAADAEKALVNIMESNYNEVTYSKYPESTDGLWGKGFEAYGFCIEEMLVFFTQNSIIRGGIRYSSDEPDMIWISDNEVQLAKSPVHTLGSND
jgi:hypothetical protein